MPGSPTIHQHDPRRHYLICDKASDGRHGARGVRRVDSAAARRRSLFCTLARTPRFSAPPAIRPSGAPGALASASDRRHGTSSMSSCQSGPHRSRRGPGKRSCNPGDCVFATSLSPLVSYSNNSYSPASPRTPSTASDEEQEELRRRQSTHQFRNFAGHGQHVFAAIKLKTHDPSTLPASVASRPRNARGMLRRASGRAERDGARGEASTHSGLRPAYRAAVLR